MTSSFSDNGWAAILDLPAEISRSEITIIFYQCYISFFFHMEKQLLRNLMETADFPFFYMLNDWP